MPYHVDPIPGLKRQLAGELASIVRTGRALDIALLLGTDSPRISDLRNGKLERFSLERLIRFASRAGYDVELRVTRRRFKNQ